MQSEPLVLIGDALRRVACDAQRRSPRGDLGLEVGPVTLQLTVARLDLGEHVVERGGQ